jgi:leader peptidase (prepilin peptidase)/N-methyltransferase
MIVGLILSFLFGSIIGSFLNVLTMRLPEEETIQGHSHCNNCHHQLRPWDLVPLFSYILLRGKCRYCKKPFSRRYLYMEVITGLLFALCFARLFPGTTYEFFLLFKYFIISAILLVVFMIDFEHSLILDNVVIFSAITLFFYNFGLDWFGHVSWINSLTLNGSIAALGLFLFFGALHHFSKGRWMGFGDVKFSFVLGLITVFPVIIVNIFLSFLIGSVVGIILLIGRTKNLRSEIPFGTFLAVSTMICLLYGPELIKWYFKLIGLRLYA